MTSPDPNASEEMELRHVTRLRERERQLRRARDLAYSEWYDAERAAIRAENEFFAAALSDPPAP